MDTDFRSLFFKESQTWSKSKQFGGKRPQSKQKRSRQTQVGIEPILLVENYLVARVLDDTV